MVESFDVVNFWRDAGEQRWLSHNDGAGVTRRRQRCWSPIAFFERLYRELFRRRWQ